MANENGAVDGKGAVLGRASGSAFPSVATRLMCDSFETDHEESHIEVDQELVRATGCAELLVNICPAHVYSLNADGTLAIEYAACLECGSCLAVAPTGALSWHYPAGGMGIAYREG